MSSSQTIIRSESEMVPELRPVMLLDLFKAAIEGNSDVLIRRLGLQPVEQTEIQVLTEEKDFAKTSILNRPRQLNALSYPMVTMQASHSAPEQIKTEHQTVQSELQSATRFGDTILHLLVTKGHNELASMVFRRDVSLLKSPNKNLETPLHCAVKFGNENVIHILIQIDPVAVKDALKQKNEHGDTALHVAATYDHIGISLALMNLDPEVAYRVNNSMFSALNVAIDINYTEMVHTMLEQDHTLAYTQFSTGMFPVHLAASMGNKKLVFHLMEKYPDCAELLDPRGRNLFHYAAEENKYNIFQVTSEDTSIKEMMTRMNIAKDCEGNTPLHIAAMKGHRFTMEAICKNKMNDVSETIQNKQGLTPFELSMRHVVETYKDIDYDRISEYIADEGHKFTKKWFNDVMVPSLENKWEKTQVIGLGSVLITTVTFAATFTIPRGYNQDHGTLVLGRRYMFRTFILANTLAFIQGFISLFSLLIDTLTGQLHLALPFVVGSFMLAASSMVVAFGLRLYVMVVAFGLRLYVTLAPVCYPIAVLILVITMFLGSPSVYLVVFYGESIFTYVSESLSATKAGLFLWAFYAVFFLLIFCLAFL